MTDAIFNVQEIRTHGDRQLVCGRLEGWKERELRFAIDKIPASLQSQIKAGSKLKLKANLNAQGEKGLLLNDFSL